MPTFTSVARYVPLVHVAFTDLSFPVHTQAPTSTFIYLTYFFIDHLLRLLIQSTAILHIVYLSCNKLASGQIEPGGKQPPQSSALRGRRWGQLLKISLLFGTAQGQTEDVTSLDNNEETGAESKYQKFRRHCGTTTKNHERSQQCYSSVDQRLFRTKMSLRPPTVVGKYRQVGELSEHFAFFLDNRNEPCLEAEVVDHH